MIQKLGLNLIKSIDIGTIILKVEMSENLTRLMVTMNISRQWNRKKEKEERKKCMNQILGKNLPEWNYEEKTL